MKLSAALSQLSDLHSLLQSALSSGALADAELGELTPVAAVATLPTGATLGRVFDAPGYMANAEEGFQQDGVTPSVSGLAALAERKRLADLYANDERYKKVDPPLLRFTILRGYVQPVAPLGDFGTSQYQGQYDDISFAEWVATNEGSSKYGDGKLLGDGH